MKRRSSKSSRLLTAEIAAEIKRLWRDTSLTQHEIAALVGVNQGRVCEVVNEYRFANVLANPPKAA
ncbi:MAG: hypothetical protein Hens3KO_17510 [Henriciella sp.]